MRRRGQASSPGPWICHRALCSPPPRARPTCPRGSYFLVGGGGGIARPHLGSGLPAGQGCAFRRNRLRFHRHAKPAARRMPKIRLPDFPTLLDAFTQAARSMHHCSVARLFPRLCLFQRHACLREHWAGAWAEPPGRTSRAAQPWCGEANADG